jgi:hypothetical protein
MVRENITKVINLTSYFHGFVNEEINEEIMEEVSKEKLKVVLASSRRTRAQLMDGWLCIFSPMFL